ncbi:DUF6438 domain-containing protein [Hyphobacterium sp. HN65]|uniref:DUF6438 domain-containing protein n=1 Tax=Hyphobacterium lacteum TaxID=3116575 RepID=A0ABU7LRV5_9PROT|nr:DUF6438 domain-containing protein [Hyphobacterium sp. HN65]MEE2526645.1 DUF6438 domain-containing protein [Hyphobacterium sp. HN65]
MRAFLIPLSLFALAACATTGNSSDRIEISEGPCFGACPIYELVVTPDDHYELDGQRFTRINGFSEGDLPRGSFVQMRDLLDRADFFRLPENYTFSNPDVCPGPELSDMPSITITYTTRRGSHTVTWYQGCRAPNMRDLRDGLRDAFGYEDIVRPG